MSSTKTYRKIVVRDDRFGGRIFSEATKIVEVDLPEQVPSGHVRVRVLSTGIEASDIIQMAGGYGALAGKRPATKHDGTNQVGDLGCEGVGIVTALADDVDTTQFPVGCNVAFYGFGVSFREYVDLVAEPSGPSQSLIQVPTSDPEWTALPVSALTATGGLELAGKIKKDLNVLVTGAAGGTGHIAVQWAKKIWNANVAGTCGSEEKRDMLSALGCDTIVNYRTQDVEAVLRAAYPSGFDLIYDGVGGKVGNMARRLLNEHGTLVSIGSVSNDYTGATPSEDLERPAQLPGQTFTGFFMPNGPKHKEWPELVERTVTAFANGHVKIVLDAECESYRGLEGVYEAQKRMRTGLNVGKIYATISDPSSGADRGLTGAKE